MYTEFFGLNEKPFSITPDPRYLYLSRRHADALAHLIYGISESGGFIQLTGEVGTGKTTLIRSVLEQLPEKAEIALILNPQLSSREFIESICDELRMPIPPTGSLRVLIGALNNHLLEAHAQGRRIVLIVDEAQTLGAELLEQVRLLTNLETATQKLLQIILIGQPELRDLLGRPEMRQIAQRITGRYHLEPLTRAETAAYVRHRLRVAGCQTAIFGRSAVRELYRRSKGIPRLINVVADRALLAAYTQDRTRVDGRLVRQAAAEVFGRRLVPFAWPWAVAAAGVAATALGVSGLLSERTSGGSASEASAPTVPASTAVARPAPEPGATTAGARTTFGGASAVRGGLDGTAPPGGEVDAAIASGAGLGEAARTAARSDGTTAGREARAGSSASGASSSGVGVAVSSGAAGASISGVRASISGVGGASISGASGSPRAGGVAPLPATVEDIVADPTFPTDMDGAFAALFELWDARYDRSRGAPCDQAVEQRLKCLFRPDGSIDTLLESDRPAILTLIAADGQMHHVTVARLGQDEAEVTVAGRTATIDVAELDEHWLGDHLILWRPPSAANGLIGPGMQGPGVVWLRDSLATIRGEDPTAQPSPIFDPPLEAEVRRYQRERGLVVDGIVGDMTQLALTADLGEPAGPTLDGEN